MNYAELGSYKEKISRMFIQDDFLIDLVMPQLDNEKIDKEGNFVGGTYNCDNESIKLVGHLFDVPFICTTITDNRNVICMDTFISRAEGETIKEITVQIFVISSKETILFNDADKKTYRKLGYLGNRNDAIVQRIGELLNGSTKFGLGRFKPIPRNPVMPYSPQNEFFGKVMTYVCDDFMTDYSARSVNNE